MNIERSLSPLTLIAIFAGIIEASALASLPFLSEKSQTTYTWFLVGFPFFLTVLFFLTLNFNHQSLYLPTPPDAESAAGQLPPSAPLAPPATALDSAPAASASPGAFARGVESKTIALSGPEAEKMIETYILRTVKQPCPQARSWTLYNLNTRICIRLSVNTLADGEERLEL